MKSKRHEKILELILENSVDTQEELLRLLRREGFDVTQATVSRDIKELRLVKTLEKDGRYRYTFVTPEKQPEAPNKFISIFIEAVYMVDHAGQIVVLKCHTGMANAACAALDLMKLDGIVGTLSGDDTIFVLVRDEKKAGALVLQLRKILQGR